VLSKHTIPLLFVSLLLGGCYQSAEIRDLAKTTHPPTPGEPLVLNLKRAESLDQLIDTLKDPRVVFVGESHNRVDHHALQLAVLKGLAKQGKPLALGVEWFQRPYQRVLDDYLAGKIDTATMLERSGYYDRWRFDYRLYQPIIQFARQQHIPIVALNAEKELTGEVGKKSIDGLSTRLAKRLPSEIDRGDKAYEERIHDTYKQHPGAKHPFKNFLDVQLTWDETMAESAANYLRAHPDSRMLILAGSGHIAWKNGIPNRLSRRLPSLNSVTILADDGRYPTPEVADYLVFTQSKTLPPPAKIGVFLKTEDNRLEILEFSKKGHGKDAGMKAGDIIVAVEGKPVHTLSRLKLLLSKHKAGDRVRVTVERDGRQRVFDLKLV